MLHRRGTVQRISAAAALVLFGAASCSLPYGLGQSGYTGPLVTADPLATQSPTAFIPQAPTQTPLPTAPATTRPLPSATSVDPWGDFPGPVEASAIEIPRPAPVISFPESVVNFILLGSDQRPNEAGFRTDTMMIVSMNPESETVTLFSIPRDLYVYLPGWRVDRINVADVRGGPEMVRQTILYNFGIPVQHWARINFGGFVLAIDALGGIDVQITGYLSDGCSGVNYTYSPGTVRHMDGWTALCYVRMRQNTGDIDRLRRQQEVVQAIFYKIVSLDGLSRVPELVSQFSNLMQTDITAESLLPLVPMATQVASDPSAIRRFAIDTTMAPMWRVPYSGASVLLPNREAIQALLQVAFGS